MQSYSTIDPNLSSAFAQSTPVLYATLNNDLEARSFQTQAYNQADQIPDFRQYQLETERNSDQNTFNAQITPNQTYFPPVFGQDGSGPN